MSNFDTNKYRRGSIFKLRVCDELVAYYCGDFDCGTYVEATCEQEYISYTETEIEHVGFDENIVDENDACIGNYYYGFGNCEVDETELYRLTQIDKDDTDQKFEFTTKYGDIEWVRNISLKPNIVLTHDVNGNRINGEETPKILTVDSYKTDHKLFYMGDEEEEIDMVLPKMQRAII